MLGIPYQNALPESRGLGGIEDIPSYKIEQHSTHVSIYNGNDRQPGSSEMYSDPFPRMKMLYKSDTLNVYPAILTHL
jgi:hypothetical protein